MDTLIFVYTAKQYFHCSLKSLSNRVLHTTQTKRRIFIRKTYEENEHCSSPAEM